MNPFQIVIQSSLKHPWLLALLIAAVLAHWADMNWPGWHLSYISKTLFSIATIYAAGSSLAPPPAADLTGKPDTSPAGTNPNDATIKLKQ